MKQLMILAAATTGLLGMAMLTVTSAQPTRVLTRDDARLIYGGDTATQCWITNTANCPAAQDCTNTPCDPTTKVCPANTVTTTQSQATYPNASAVNPPFAPNVTPSGGNTPKAPIFCATTYTCTGCYRPQFSMQNWCAKDANKAGTPSNSVTPIIPDGTNCAVKTQPGGS